MGRGIYTISSPNGSCYIGLTTRDFNIRWGEHKKDFKLGRTKCYGLRKAFEKYGLDNMSFEILEDIVEADQEYFLQRETLWWDRHKAWDVNIYNGRPSGNGSVIHLPETKEKISLSVKNFADDGKEPYPHCPNCGTLLPKRSRKFCDRECIKNFKFQKTNLVDKETLYNMYWKDSMSTESIGKVFDLSGTTIVKIMVEYGIPRRSRKEQQKRLLSLDKFVN